MVTDKNHREGRHTINYIRKYNIVVFVVIYNKKEINYMEPKNLNKEQKNKLSQIKPGDVISFYPYHTGNYNKYLNTEKIQTFLVWEISAGQTDIMNITGQIIQDDDPYGQAPDSISIDQVIGKASEKETKLANLCSEWRSIGQRSNIDIKAEIPEGTTWEQFKKIKRGI